MYREDRSGSPFVLPTFRAILITEIKRVMDSIDEGNIFAAYASLKTLTDVLKPTDRQGLLENDVAQIERLLKQARNLKGLDWFQTARIRVRAKTNILENNIRPLFRKIMTKLHEGGYLEKKPVQPKSKGSGRLKIE